MRLQLAWSIFLPLVFGISALTCERAVANDQLSADKLFESDRVVQMDIELPETEWDKIRLQSRSFGNALGKLPAESPFTYVKANIKIDGKLIKDVGIRKKGFLGSLDTRKDRKSTRLNSSHKSQSRMPSSA